ncbi:hypothetical protein PIB30_010167 [Stylosanthes scabra]|uniref:Putative plant transposon protein domain-containing protein n=1 Tax=Stylosanthes scabra TaxID=79078 RepID=A0ABU6Q5C4_9FABA|nr:hypothetical protein [Stylosanthes scabra]
MVRGNDINFAPSDIKRVLKLKKDPLPNVGSYHDRKPNNDLRLDEVQECLCNEGGEWVRHRDGRPHYLKRTDLDPMAKGWYDFVCRSILPTTNRFEVTVERAVLIHSIMIGDNINVEEIIANQIYKFVYKTDLSSSLPFPSIIALLCLEAKASIPNDTLIPQEPPIVGEAMVRVREPRARNPRQARQPRQEAPQQQPPQAHNHKSNNNKISLPTSTLMLTNSMSMIYRRLDNHQEESRKNFEALNTRMNRFDDQLSFLCYSNQMTNEQMLSPYQDTTRLMREIEMQGIPVTMANLAIYRQKEEEMRQERMGCDQILQEAAAEKAREENKGKARDVEEEDEDTDEEDSNGSEECVNNILPRNTFWKEREGRSSTTSMDPILEGIQTNSAGLLKTGRPRAEKERLMKKKAKKSDSSESESESDWESKDESESSSSYEESDSEETRSEELMLRRMRLPKQNLTQ